MERAVGGFGGAGIMGDHDDRFAVLAGEGLKGFEDLGGAFAVEVAGRQDSPDATPRG